MRRVLLHYHLFKNAGTSLDAILRASFGGGWVEREFGPDDQLGALRAMLEGQPNIAALSSHTLFFPLPRFEGFEFFPVIFVRQPLVRLRSAYEFEQWQDADTLGAILAKQMRFGDYLERRLADREDRACRDFQAHRLALYVPAELGSERARALAAVELLPFVGLVEQFDRSVMRLQELLAAVFPQFQAFSIRANVTAGRAGQAEVIEWIRREIGPAVFASLIAANQADLAVYERVRRMYDG